MKRGTRSSLPIEDWILRTGGSGCSTQEPWLSCSLDSFAASSLSLFFSSSLSKPLLRSFSQASHDWAQLQRWKASDRLQKAHSSSYLLVHLHIAPHHPGYSSLQDSYVRLRLQFLPWPWLQGWATPCNHPYLCVQPHLLPWCHQRGVSLRPSFRCEEVPPKSPSIWRCMLVPWVYLHIKRRYRRTEKQNHRLDRRKAIGNWSARGIS